mmetsp:Transcript_74357/g.240379  ORF Transcript_74357/g.240379 Transcript_74357/m.240379 type:complete len:307 (-) Transcript_74357:29-949(-)
MVQLLVEVMRPLVVLCHGLLARGQALLPLRELCVLLLAGPRALLRLRPQPRERRLQRAALVAEAAAAALRLLELCLQAFDLLPLVPPTSSPSFRRPSATAARARVRLGLAGGDFDVQLAQLLLACPEGVPHHRTRFSPVLPSCVRALHGRLDLLLHFGRLPLVAPLLCAGLRLKFPHLRSAIGKLPAACGQLRVQRGARQLRVASAAQPQNKVDSGAFSDAAVVQSASIFQIVACVNQALAFLGNPFLGAQGGLQLPHSVRSVGSYGHGPARQSPHKKMHLPRARIMREGRCTSAAMAARALKPNC